MPAKVAGQYFPPFLLAIIFLNNPASAQEINVLSILNGFAKDYEQDVTLKSDVTFGVKVDNQFYQVKAVAKTDDSPAHVAVTAGPPAEPTFYFYTDGETLKKIERGSLNALTGAAKAFESDFAPFDADVMEGFQPDAGFLNTLLSTMFHFWTKGVPERIPFGLDYTRMTHGAQASIFYYQEGFRSAYVAVKKGQHANQDERSRSNPFPTLFIATNGQGMMIINGVTSPVAKGEAIFIPAGMEHEFYNENDEPLEGILLMFGDGA